MTGSVELFTVRLWQEMLNEKQTEWRGKIQHVGSGEVCYFRDWSKMMEFIDTTLLGLGNQKAEITTASESGDFRLGGMQKERRRARLVPEPESADSSGSINKTWQQYQTTRWTKKVKGPFPLRIFQKLWRALYGGNTNRLRVVKSLGVMLIAALLIGFGLNHMFVIDLKTTSAIFGTKPLLVGITGIFEGLSQQQPEKQSAKNSGKAYHLENEAEPLLEKEV